MWAKIVNDQKEIADNNDTDNNDDATTTTYYSSEEDEYNIKLKYEMINLKKNLRTIDLVGRDFEYEETYGWDTGKDKTIAAQNTIKRFNLRKLKSPKEDTNTYYGDRATYFLWKYEKNSATGEELLVKPSKDVYLKLQQVNSIRFKPFLAQPDIFWN
jgi:hypothetical protein